MTATRRLVLATLALAAAAPHAFAAATVLTPQDKALVDKAIAYLEGLTSAKGRFIQTDARGSQTQGTFYLQRPGKARFSYDPPSGLIMASDGHTVSVVNTRLKTFQRYPLGLTPLGLFLGKEIRLDRGVVVKSVVRLSDGFKILAGDRHKQADGQIELRFSNDPLMLRGWTLRDGQGHPTQVDLVELSRSTPFDASLFDLKDTTRSPPVLR